MNNKPRQALTKGKSKRHGKTAAQPTQHNKTSFHVRNLHKSGYDFKALCESLPELSLVVVNTVKGQPSINFSDSKSVKLLNQALLKHHYQIDDWHIPENYLCPAIPGRVDYLHYLADLLALSTKGKIPRGRVVKALDIGTGANCIYPLLGTKSYGWSFVGSDVDVTSLQAATNTVNNNNLASYIECRQQHDSSSHFSGVIQANERFDISLCNPPFHSSLAEAKKSNIRKQRNLAANKNKKSNLAANDKLSKSVNSSLNFSGQGGELWCEGGELAFLTAMLKQSQEFSEQCLWFTTLVSKQENIKPLQAGLKSLAAKQVRVIDMLQGQKKTRVLAWSYYTEQQQEIWAQHYW